jgi:hypothetical protein
MIWMPSQNCTCAVELLGQDQTGQGMGHGQGAERQQKLRSLSGLVAPAIRRPDGEHNLADSLIAVNPDPRSKGLRSHRTAAAIEQHRHRRGPPFAAIEPGKQIAFAAECLLPAEMKCRAPRQIGCRQCAKFIVRHPPARADVGQNQFHPNASREQARREPQVGAPGSTFPCNCPFLEFGNSILQIFIAPPAGLRPERRLITTF